MTLKMKRQRRQFDVRIALLAGAVIVSASCGGSESPSTLPSPTLLTPQTSTNVLTCRNDTYRTGQDLTETVLTSANVKSSSFGKLFSVSMDGKVDAQPLYVSQSACPEKASVLLCTQSPNMIPCTPSMRLMATFFGMAVCWAGKKVLPMIEAVGR